jgi:hypothetical protein
MKKYFFLLALLIPTAVFALSETSVDGQRELNIGRQTALFDERSSNPATPTTNKIRLFSKDDGGTTKLHTIDSAGVVTPLASTASFDTSAELAAILTDETGTAGSAVFSASPSLTGDVSFGGAVKINGTAEITEDVLRLKPINYPATRNTLEIKLNDTFVDMHPMDAGSGETASDIEVDGGNSPDGSGNAGNLFLYGGTSGGAGNGGNIGFGGGESSGGSGGYITAYGGNSSTGIGGGIEFYAGESITSTGGDVVFGAGSGTTDGTIKFANPDNQANGVSLDPDLGILTLKGFGGSNNEDVSFDFETNANGLRLYSSTAMSLIGLDAISLALENNQNFLFRNSIASGSMGSSLAGFQADTAETNDGLKLGLVGGGGTSGNMTLAITELADIDTNFGIATASNPTLRIQSADAGTTDDYIQIYHDQTDARIDVGDGSGTGLLKVGGVGGTNNENLMLNFESTANTIGIRTSTGVSSLSFEGMGMVIDGSAQINGNSSNELTVGSILDTDVSSLNVLSSASTYSEVNAYGTGQGAGMLYVGQDASYGGGLLYNGDGSPAMASGENSDRVTFFRRNAATNTTVFAYSYDANTVHFADSITMPGDAADSGVLRMANAAVVGWEASPSGTDITLTTNSSEALVTNTNNLTIGGGSTPNQFTFANPGIASASTVEFTKTNDSARITVTETASDATTYQFYMADNPDSTNDKFNWFFDYWGQAGGDWMPLQFSGYDARIVASDIQTYGAYSINGPTYTGGGVPSTVSEITKVGTATITPNVDSYSGDQTFFCVVIDGEGTPDTFKWGTGSCSPGFESWSATLVSMTGSAQTLTAGVTITWSSTTAGTLNDRFAFTALRGGYLTFGTDPADAGRIRLDNAQNIAWEASPAGTDTTLGLGTDEALALTGVGVVYSDGDQSRFQVVNNADQRHFIKVKNTATNTTALAPKAGLDLDVANHQTGGGARARTWFELGQRTLSGGNGTTTLSTPYEFNVYTNNSASVTASQGVYPSAATVPGVLSMSLSSTDPADAGALRLGNAETIAWEASPTGTDVTISVDASEIIQASNAVNVAGAITNNSTITSSATGSLGWAVVDGTDDTACTSQCTSAAVFGFNLAAGATAPVLVGPSDATADICMCAGSS